MSDPFFLCNACKDTAGLMVDEQRQLYTINLPKIPVDSRCLMCHTEDRKELSLYFTAERNEEFVVTGAL